MIGRVSRGPLVPVPGEGWPQGWLQSHLNGTSFLLNCEFTLPSGSRRKTQNPSHPKPMLIFVQILAHPLPHQQPWGMRGAGVFLRLFSQRNGAWAAVVECPCSGLRWPGRPSGDTSVTATRQKAGILVIPGNRSPPPPPGTRRKHRRVRRQEEPGENVGRNLPSGFCGKEQAGQVSRQRAGEFESFQLRVGGYLCVQGPPPRCLVPAGGESRGRGEGCGLGVSLVLT